MWRFHTLLSGPFLVLSKFNLQATMLWTRQELIEMYQEENTTANGEDGTSTYGLRVTERLPQAQGSVTSFPNKASG